MQRFNPICSLLLLVSAILLTSCGKQAENSSFSTGESAGNSDGTRWSGNRFPLDLRVSNAFTAAEATGVEDMTEEWHTAVENKVEFFQGIVSTANLEYTDLDDYNDGVMGVYRLNTWPGDLPSSALAVTQLYGIRSGATISLTHADILLNEDAYDFSTDPDDFTAYDFHTVMLHELGHFLGLGHESFSVDSVMQPSVSKLDSNRETTNVDRANIASLYGVSTSYNLTANDSVSLQAGLSRVIAGATSEGNGETEKVKFIIQLMEDGECQHSINGEIYMKHHVDLQ